MAVTPPRRKALAPPARSLPDFERADDPGRTDIVPTPLRLLEDSRARSAEPRYTICGEFEYGGLPDVRLAFLEGAAGFRRAVVVQRLTPPRGSARGTPPLLSPDALLGCHTRHPNVIPVVDVIERQGEHLLVLEYVISTTLGRLLWHGNRLPLPVSVAIVSGVLHALQAAHGATDALDVPLEIVHGGVSPENVLVGVDGTARLIHFGQAKGARKAAQVTRGYASPEQVFEQRADVRSDVFSAGVLLWECLSGKTLLEGGSAVDAMLRFIARPLTPASTFNPQVPASLDLVLARALEPTPERRFQSALSLLEALEALVAPASREEVARYVEGVAWSSLHEQRLLLRGPDDDELANLPSSQICDRPDGAPGAEPRRSAGSEDPTLARGYFVDPNLSGLKSEWQTRSADEPTRVDGVVRPAPLPPPLLADAADDSVPPLNLAAPRTPRLPVPPIQPLPSDARIPRFGGDPRRLSRLLWCALGLGAAAFLATLAQTPQGRSAQRALASWVSPGAPSKLTPPARPQPAPKASASRAPEPAREAPSLRVFTLDDLPLAEPEPSDEASKKKPRRAPPR